MHLKLTWLKSSCMAGMLAVLVLCLGLPLRAWEGHDWAKWREVTTWQKPTSHTDQAGRSNLAPVLGGESGATNHAEAMRQWQERRRLYAETIAGILGSPTN